MDNPIFLPPGAINLDWTYTTAFLAGSPAGTINLVANWEMPKNTVGQIILIENQSANVDMIVPYVHVNNKRVPQSFMIAERPFLKEDREYSIWTFIKGGYIIDLFATNTNAIGIADVNAYVRLWWWYIDWSIIENHKNESDYSKIYKMFEYLRNGN